MPTASQLTTPDGFRLGVHRAGAGGDGKALLVLLPGGTYTGAYFGVAGHSLLDAAAARGFEAVALDRPNYGGSDTLPYEQTTFAENARILSQGIGVLWDEAAPGTPGVVILAHSIGGSIAVHIAAAEDRAWPLLGLSFSGVNEKSPEHVVQAWQSVPAGVPVELSSEQRRMFMYGPDGSFDPAMLEAAAPCSVAAPLPELLEIVQGWLTDVAVLAPLVDVPVHYTLAEHDALWLSGEDRVKSFAGKFTRAPFVESRLLEGVGHNIDHHHAGAAFHQDQLDFAGRCARQADAQARGSQSLQDVV
jgi:pimeloyl-ACP methyl ester carboxylesterase